MASSSTGEQRRWSKTTNGGVVSPTSLRPVGTGFTGPTAPDINNAKSRFPCWLFGAGTVPVELVQGANEVAPGVRTSAPLLAAADWRW